MKRLASKKLLTVITVLALLLLIPAGTLLADSLKNPKNTGNPEEDVLTMDTETPEEPEASEDPEDEGEGSENSIAVSERVAAAKLEGIPPGHLNLIDKLAGFSDMTWEDLLPEWRDASVQEIMQEIKRLRFEKMGKEVPGKPEIITEETIAGDSGDETGNNGKGLGKGHNKE